MKTFIIYDDRFPEKEPLFRKEMERQCIFNYTVFPAIILTHSVVESISESFKSLIRMAKENGWKEIMIMEDDIHFPSKFGYDYFLRNKPKEYDIYIGGTYLIDNRIEYKSPVVKVPEYIGNHCIIVNERYYDKWLLADSKQHCDTVHKDGEFYVCFPFAALQRGGLKSANHSINGSNVPVNYNTNILLYHPEFIYR